MVVERKTASVVLFDIFLFVFLMMAWFSCYDSTQLPDNWAAILSVSSIALFCLHLVQMRILRIGPSSFMFWYIILQYLFYYGRIILYWLDLDQYVSWHLFNQYSHLTIYHAGIFALCFSQGVFIGMALFQKPKINSDEDIEYKCDMYSGNAMTFAGIVMMLVTLPFLVNYSYQTILAQQSGGYVAAAEGVTGITQSLSQAFFAGVLMLMCSPTIRRGTKKLIILLYTVYGVAYMIMAADRRQIVIALIVLLICYIKFYQVKLKIGNMILLVIIAFFGLNLLSAISSVRTSGISIESLFDEFQQQLQGNNILVDTLGEFGGTFFTLVNSLSYYPSKFDYVYGGTYIAAVLLLVPRVFTTLFPKLFSSARITANMKATDGNPCGGSLGQDLIANFGSFGVFFTIPMGIILSKMTREYENPTPIDTCRSYVKFYICLNFVRAGWYEMLRTYVYTLLIMEILFLLYRQFTAYRGETIKGNESNEK